MLKQLVGILVLLSAIGCATWASAAVVKGVTLAQVQTWVSSYNNLVVPV